MPEIDILVEAGDWRALADLEGLVRRAVNAALSRRPEIAASVSILLTDDDAVQRLNNAFRGKDSPTNVLSFPASARAGDPEPSFGDIALAYGTCAREAAAEGKSLGDHLSHLLVHGVLHLLGHHHDDDADAEAMEARETAILAGLGIADPYADTAFDAEGRI